MRVMDLQRNLLTWSCSKTRRVSSLQSRESIPRKNSCILRCDRIISSHKMHALKTKEDLFTKQGGEMDQEKIGKFILEMRKQKGLTQKELAELVGISDKTISKWECGNSMPDISYLEGLCNSLGITVNELLSGQCLTGESYSEKAEENIMALMKENESNKKEGMGRIAFGALLAIVSIAMLLITWEGINGLVRFWGEFLDVSGVIIYFMLCLSGILLSGKKEAKLSVLQKIAIPNGVLLSMMQLVIMLHRLDDLAAVGPAVSVAMLIVIYGIVTYLVATILLVYKEKEDM